MIPLENLVRSHRHNVTTMRRSPLLEISGALGDLGTLLPLLIALARQGSISLSSTLVFSGCFNIVTGLVFGIPLPVQPMKAIAAAAIANRLGGRESVAAGAWVSAAVLILSATGLLRWLTRWLPVPVVKGIQLGAGLSLVIAAGTTLLEPLHWATPILDNRIWALAAFLALVCTQRLPRFPYAAVMVLLGVVFAFIALLMHHRHLSGDGDNERLPHFALWTPRLLLPDFLSRDALGLAIAQLPLTTLNSIIAASALAADLFPDLPTPGVTALGLSVAAMNLLGCWFGAMPVCHGSGGLAAQYRFGARSGASIVLLGAAKALLGLVFGDSLLGLLHRFPFSILGVLVIAAGLELAKVGNSLNYGASDLWEDAVEGGDGGSRQRRRLTDEAATERWTVMIMTASIILAFRNDAVGFAAGMLCHWAYRLSYLIAERRRHRSGHAEHEPLLR